MKAEDILCNLKICASRAEAKRYIAGGAVKFKLKEKKVTPTEEYNENEIEEIKIGKSIKILMDNKINTQ